MLNKVILVGRLTGNPELRVLQNGMSVAVFSIAVNRKYKDKNGNWQEESYFFDIEAFGQLAERIGKQLAKGYQVLIEGQLRQDRWEDKNGEKRSKVKIIAERISLLSKPNGNTAEEEIVDDVPW
ncbi:MAG: single-stranded DNA-binding protein [Sulfurihydrogenibium sp.]|jgi:single-strand DNA-binding protein|nr:single-stranded DNA-binding protein [Sulfurihydrogenibium sp.]